MSMSAQDNPLSVELIQKNLGRVGRHPITLQHAFLQLIVSKKGLTNIDALGNFPHIMYLDIAENSVESLSVLAKLPTLVELDARFTTLLETLEFRWEI